MASTEPSSGVGASRHLVELRRRTRDHYERFPFIEGGSARVDRWRAKLERELPELFGVESVLDVGCGSAEVAAALAANGSEVLCLDLTASAVGAASRRGLIACQGDALRLPFPDRAFPAALAMGVLHHTPDCRAALAEAARVTASTVAVLVYSRNTPYHLAYVLFAPVRTHVDPDRLLPRAGWSLRSWRWVFRVFTGLELDDGQVRRMLADQFWTPKASFHSRREIARWAAEVGFEDRRVRTYAGYSRLHILERARRP